MNIGKENIVECLKGTILGRSIIRRVHAEVNDMGTDYFKNIKCLKIPWKFFKDPPVYKFSNQKTV
jgi:hypothetical protein